MGETLGHKGILTALMVPETKEGAGLASRKEGCRVKKSMKN